MNLQSFLGQPRAECWLELARVGISGDSANEAGVKPSHPEVASVDHPLQAPPTMTMYWEKPDEFMAHVIASFSLTSLAKTSFYLGLVLTQTCASGVSSVLNSV
jgi:hypothetical protein